MGVISAKSGAISTGSAEDMVSAITIEYNEQSAEWGASNTAGSVGKTMGNSDWSAEFTLYGAVANVVPGASITLTAYTGAATFSGPMLVDEITITADIKGGGIISATVRCSANGALTRGAGTVTDSSTPAPLSVKGLKVNLAGSDRTDATGWTLTLRSDNKPYNSTATAGVTKRVAGRVNASGSWTELEGTPATLPAVGLTGGSNILKLYVNATEFYEIKWPIVESVSTPIPIESGEIIESTIAWGFNGYDGAAGYLKLPSTTNFWP